MNPPGPRIRQARVPRNIALRWLSSVRLGLALIVAIAIYAALGTIPLGGFFELFGGADRAPGTTIRHLPQIDLREPEYYATPFFGFLLVALVVNMSFATALRIPWRLDRAGVILTHAGVAVLAVGAFLATRSPLNATIALFADEPSSRAIDRSRSVLESLESDGRFWRLDDRLPRFADFGVPWTDREGEIVVDAGVRITGFAHSARVVPRIVSADSESPPGWELEESLRTGERRTLCLLASADSQSRQRLTDGTTLLALDGSWPIEQLEGAAMDAMRTRGTGLVWIEPEPGLILALPASSGEVLQVESEKGIWRAEFLDRTGFVPGTTLANYRLSGPGFEEQILFAASWDPTTQGTFADLQPTEESPASRVPEGFRALFIDEQSRAILLHPSGLLTMDGTTILMHKAQEGGKTIRTGPGLELRISRFEANAQIASDIEFLPFVEDPQLLADPRLGSAVRVERDSPGGVISTWLGFDDTESMRDNDHGFRYGPMRFELSDVALALRSFEAELFPRGSVPKDFQIGIELASGDGATLHQLSLNQPIRATVRIGERTRRVQFSLIGWDAAGWEAARSGEVDGFEGVRYVILSMNHREGVGTALFGGGLILLGAGFSLASRLIVPVARRARASGGDAP